MKVLIAEDDPTENILLKNTLLRWGYETVCVFDGQEAWKVLQGEDPPAIAILDLTMPGLDGMEVVSRTRELEKGSDRYTYLIILTGRNTTQDMASGIEAGADDYIIKPFNKEELLARLRSGQRIIELQSSLRATNRKLLLMSRLDPITGALSRSALLEELDMAMYRSGREKKPLSVLLIDIDDLRSINRSHGRRVGDRLLQDLARRVSSQLRRTDALGRWDGDEFAAVLLGADANTVPVITGRIKRAVEEKAIPVDEDLDVPVTISCGAAVWDGRADKETFMTEAQKLLLERRTFPV